MYSDELSNTLRMELQPMERFRQHCDAKDATDKGLNAGDQFHWNVYSDVATQGTTLVENQDMPETNFTITQGSLTITEFGNSVPFNSKLDNLSKHPVEEVIRKVLKNDATKALDRAAFDQFDATKLVVTPTLGTSTTAVDLNTDGTAPGTNNVAMGKDHIKAIVDIMKERNIPAFRGGDYMAIAWPTTYRSLKNDLESVHQYVDQGWRQIVNGEIGRYEGVRFVEQTNVAKSSWTNAKSDWAFFFGEDTVAEAIAIPEEIRGKIPTDFGRSKGIAWYALLGYGLVHTDADNSRIVKWGSAS
jgi:N4-gp56 family major capsid protein